jgi:hypothetical protein
MFYYQFYYQSNYQFYYQPAKDLSLIVNLIVDLGCGVPSDPFNPVLSCSKILADPSLGIYTKLRAALPIPVVLQSTTGLYILFVKLNCL